MKILLIGCPPEITVLLETLVGSSDGEIVHCADETHAIAALHGDARGRNRPYSDAPAAGAAKDGAGAVHATGSRTSASHAAAGPAISCGVEWSKGGILQLHCRLHSVLCGNALAQPAPLPDPTEGFFFEYHAPCDKERKRHG